MKLTASDVLIDTIRAWGVEDHSQTGAALRRVTGQGHTRPAQDPRDGHGRQSSAVDMSALLDPRRGNRQGTTFTATLPVRRGTLSLTPSRSRSSTISTFAPSTLRLRIAISGSDSGSIGCSSETSFLTASTCNPIEACNNMKTEPAAHDCGEHATG